MEKSKKKLILELPPSINHYLIYAPNLHRFIHSKEARTYLEYGEWKVKIFCMQHKIKPIERYTPLKLYWYLKDKRSDSHNYKKLLFDCLQKGGMFKDDKYIMDQTVHISIDKTDPRVEIGL